VRNIPGLGGGVGGRYGISFANLNFIKHGSWGCFPRSDRESETPHYENLDQNEKLWTRIKILPSTAIVVYHDV
jgi:hypothetical protein